MRPQEQAPAPSWREQTVRSLLCLTPTLVTLQGGSWYMEQTWVKGLPNLTSHLVLLLHVLSRARFQGCVQARVSGRSMPAWEGQQAVMEGTGAPELAPAVGSAAEPRGWHGTKEAQR